MQILEKDWKSINLTSILWLVATIIGNPVYNVGAYFICTEFGFSKEVSTNVTQVDKGMYVIILLLIFLLRYVIYRIVFVVRLQDQMNTPFFVEAFLERHKFQIISALTFFMWIGEVEGNIAGFFYFPITILLTVSVGVVTFFRLFRMQKHLDRIKRK